MPSEVFSITYDGDDIRNGEMDVAALGPALAAMGELFAVANEVLNGSKTTVETKARATFKEGSFEVFYAVNQFLQDPHSGVMPALFVLGSDKLVGQVLGKLVDKAKEKISDAAVEGLFALFEKLKGKRPEATTYDESKHVYIFNTGDNVNISVDQPTGELYKSPRVRSAVAKVAAPLRSPGTNKLVAKRNSEDVASLGKVDIPEILEVEEPQAQHLLSDSAGDRRPEELVVKILKPSFSEGKWSVSDGSRKFEVLMEDQLFIERVHAREIGFFDGDLYRVEMMTIQKVSGARLTTQRTITRVIAPLPVETQGVLEIPSERPVRRIGTRARKSAR